MCIYTYIHAHTVHVLWPSVGPQTSITVKIYFCPQRNNFHLHGGDLTLLITSENTWLELPMVLNPGYTLELTERGLVTRSPFRKFCVIHLRWDPGFIILKFSSGLDQERSFIANQRGASLSTYSML